LLLIVHDVAQSEHEARALPAKLPQRRLDLAPKAERLLVDEEDVWAEGGPAAADDVLADGDGVLDRNVETARGVAAVPELDDTGKADEVDALAETVGADDGRA
jgi:hypothetical protein